MTDLPKPRSAHPLNPRIQTLAWMAVLIPFFAMALLRWGDGPGISSGDYAHYLLHARALAEGRSYTDTGYIFTKHAWVIGPRAQPPGLPVTLAPLLAITGENLFAIRLAMLAFAATFIFGAGRYFARHEGLMLGLGVTLLIGASVPISHTSTQVLSDLPFAALVWCLISVYDRDGPWGARRIMVATSLVAATISFRTVGIAIIPAVLLFTALQFRQHRWRPAVPVLACSALGAVAVTVSGLSLAIKDRIPRSIFRIDHEIIDRLISYRIETAEGLLYPFPTDSANDVYHALALVITVIGLASWLTNRWRSYAAAFSLSYGTMLLIAPFGAGRYLWPLFPVLLFGLINGGRILAQWVRPGASSYSQRRAVLLAAGVIALSSMVFRPSEPPRENLVSLPPVQEVFDYLRTAASTEQDIRVAFVKPRVLSWETRIPAMGLFSAAPDITVTTLHDNRITHVVLGDLGITNRANQGFRTAVARFPEAFHLQFENEAFSVYRFAEPLPRN